MKRLVWPLAVVLVPAILGAAGLLVAHAGPSAPAAPPGTIATLRPAAGPSPAATVTSTASGRPRAKVTPRPRQHVTAPWAVIRAYYRDVGSHQYAKAWALIGSGLVTGQTYEQFVAGYACTGAERPAKLSQSGHQVSFTLVVENGCTGGAQYYTGTDTIRGGKIVAADVTRTG